MFIRFIETVAHKLLNVETTELLYVWHTKMWIWKAAKMAGAACPTLKWQDRKTVGRAVPAIKLARLQHNSRSWCTAHIDVATRFYCWRHVAVNSNRAVV
jgi:hypothetical protein